RGAPLQNTLAYFRSLHALDGEQLVAALMCGCDPGRRPRATAAMDRRTQRPQAALSELMPGVLSVSATMAAAPTANHGAALFPPRVADVTRGSKTLVVVDAATQPVVGRARRNTVGEQRSRGPREAAPFRLEFGEMLAGVANPGKGRAAKHRSRRGQRDAAPYPLHFGDMTAGIAHPAKERAAKHGSRREQRDASPLRLELGNILAGTAGVMRQEAARSVGGEPPG
ncbi:MAG TPA: hypothetical protein VES39_03075, partial [Rhodospirillales bacterium]|nr:hypothetical protein [Rhodospirillales bacterium]